MSIKIKEKIQLNNLLLAVVSFLSHKANYLTKLSTAGYALSFWK